MLSILTPNPATTSSYATPIQFRKHRRDWLRTIFVGLVFDLGLICINGTHFVLWFLFGWWSGCQGMLYEMGIAWTKAAFGVLCVVMCQWFAPTNFVVTTEGMDESKLFVRDSQTGEVTGLDLPKKLVMMSNHQVYLDWWYLWAFSYFMNAHNSILIILKKSLKWIPIMGWGMQFFRFIFLARSWSADKVALGKQLTRVGKQAQKLNKPLTLMIFPEGTLVSPQTRPLSRKFADKMGFTDPKNMLLPRSTGLLFSLRTLSPFIPDLHLLDITIGYQGIPPAGYGQSYYTIRSVFMDGVPPPKVHLHLRLYNVQRDVPIGSVSESQGVSRGAEASEKETEVFDAWLRERWSEKDTLMDGFYKSGEFESTRQRPIQSSVRVRSTKMNGNGVVRGRGGVEIPVKLGSGMEAFNAFCFFAPAVVWSIFSKTKALFL